MDIFAWTDNLLITRDIITKYGFIGKMYLLPTGLLQNYPVAEDEMASKSTDVLLYGLVGRMDLSSITSSCKSLFFTLTS